MSRQPSDCFKRTAFVEALSPLPEGPLTNDAGRARDQRSIARPATAKFLRFPAVRARTGLSRSTIWRLERQGLFPRRRHISHRAVAWSADEVESWTQAITPDTDASCDHR